MKLPGYLLVSLAAIAVLGICLTSMDANLSLPAAGFTVWALSPYGGLLLLLRTSRQKTSTVIISILAPIVAGGGAWLIFAAMFIHSDAQSAMALVVVPLWQWVLIIPAGLLFYYLKRKEKKKSLPGEQES